MPKKDSAIPEQTRLQKCVEALPQALKDFERDHPEWEFEVLYWLLDRSLRSLRGYLESKTETEITWKSPFVEIQFPVECTWAKEPAEDEPSFTVQTGRLSISDMVDVDTAAKAFSRLLIQHMEIVALQYWTNHSAFQQRGDTLQPILGVDQIAELDAISDPDLRNVVGKSKFWPRSFGAGTIDFGEIQEGHSVGKEVIEQLTNVAPPLVFLPLDKDGHRIRLITIFEIKPLIANIDTKHAYFPITVGLAIQADSGEVVDERWLENPWASLDRWDDSEREVVWGALHKLIESALAAFGRKSTPDMEEAILAVNATVKVTVPKGNPSILQNAIASVVSNLQAVGKIERLEVKQDGSLLLNQEKKDRLNALVSLVTTSKRNNEKGKALESLVVALFESVPEFHVVERVKTQTEEIDLWITNNADTGPFRREGDIILVECKNWSGKCGKNEFVSLLAKLMNRGGHCTLGFLISWNGFARTIDKEMLRASLGKFRIVPLDGNWLREVVQKGKFREMLAGAREHALMV